MQDYSELQSSASGASSYCRASTPSHWGGHTVRSSPSQPEPVRLLEFDIPSVEAVRTAVSDDVARSKALAPVLFQIRMSQQVTRATTIHAQDLLGCEHLGSTPLVMTSASPVEIRLVTHRLVYLVRTAMCLPSEAGVWHRLDSGLRCRNPSPRGTSR